VEEFADKHECSGARSRGARSRSDRFADSQKRRGVEEFAEDQECSGARSRSDRFADLQKHRVF
jgi:hypothetical protein